MFLFIKEPSSVYLDGEKQPHCSGKILKMGGGVACAFFAV